MSPCRRARRSILGSIGTPPCSAHPAGADCIAADSGAHTLGELQFVQRRDDVRRHGRWRRRRIRRSALAARPGSRQPQRQDPAHQRRTARRRRTTRSTTGRTACARRSGCTACATRSASRCSPATEEIFFGDVGWNTWEEVNHGTTGANYGWPCYEGNGPQPTVPERTRAVRRAGSRAAVTPPYYTYNHAPASAVIGGPFYTGTAVSRSSTAATTSSPTTRATSSSASCSTTSTNPVGDPAVRDQRRGAGLARPSAPTG